MKTKETTSLNDPMDQLRKDALRHQRDEDLRDDDVITNPLISDSKLPAEVALLNSECKHVTLGNLDPTFIHNKHGRMNGRLVDHEPRGGFRPPEHGAYNL